MKATPGDFENHADLHADLRALREENERQKLALVRAMTTLDDVENERDAARRERDELLKLAERALSQLEIDLYGPEHCPPPDDEYEIEEFVDDLRERLAKLRAGTEGSGT